MTIGLASHTLYLTLGRQRWMLPTGRVFRIGRHTSNDLVLNDHRVSRFHAQISWSGDTPVLHDCGSYNGTFVDGLEVKGTLAIEPAQLVGIGPWDLKVRAEARENLRRLRVDAAWDAEQRTAEHYTV